MLSDIISPDAFLRPYIDVYTSLGAIYGVVANAYGRRVQVDRAFQRKTNALVQKHVTSSPIGAVRDLVAIASETIDLIKENAGGDATKIINLIKSIEKAAEEQSDDPFLVAMADRARQVQERYEDRQSSTQEALNALFQEIRRDEKRKREQAERGCVSLRYFGFTALREAGVADPESVGDRVARAFVEHPSWRASEAQLRELRKAGTFAVHAAVGDLAPAR